MKDKRLMRLISMMSIMVLFSGYSIAKERDDRRFKQYQCNENIFKEECFNYMNDIFLYKEKKKNFKENRVKYFFNPDELTKGFKTPEPYNYMIDEVFKSLKKENISKATYSVSMRMKEKMKDNFSKDIKKIVIDKNKIYDRNSSSFYTDYNRNYNNFLKKMELFEKITKDYTEIQNFQKIIEDIDNITYLFTENDMNENEYKKSLDKEIKGNFMKCYYSQYEILRLDLDINIKCEK